MNFHCSTCLLESEGLYTRVAAATVTAESICDLDRKQQTKMATQERKARHTTGANNVYE